MEQISIAIFWGGLRMPKAINFIVNWKVYPFDVMVSIGETTPIVIGRIEKLGYKLNTLEKDALEIKSSGRTVGRTVMLENGATVLRLKRFDTLPINFSILSHEVFHCVEFLMDRIGIPLTDSSSEAYSYAIQYLTNEILAKLRLSDRKR